MRRESAARARDTIADVKAIDARADIEHDTGVRVAEGCFLVETAAGCLNRTQPAFTLRLVHDLPHEVRARAGFFEETPRSELGDAALSAR